MNLGLQQYQEYVEEAFQEYSKACPERSLFVSAEVFQCRNREELEAKGHQKVFGDIDIIPPKAIAYINGTRFRTGVILFEDKKDLSTLLKVRSSPPVLDLTKRNLCLSTNNQSQSYISVESQYEFPIRELVRKDLWRLKDFLKTSVDLAILFDSKEFQDTSQFFQNIIDNIGRGYALGILENLPQGEDDLQDNLD